AMREGVLYDLMGRISDEDARRRTVAELMQRFAVDQAHVRRIAATARALFTQVEARWRLSGESHGRLLEWAASLHEIGITVSHSQYHKHGAYLLQHLDMPGFSRGEQRRLAFLVRAHRRKFPVADLGGLSDEDQTLLPKLAVLLRLAVVLHRARRAAPLPPFALSVDDAALKLSLPKEWLGDHTLVGADLEQESSYLKAIGYKLRLK
ncbi:MAG: exopolyphosphatase, partial [Gammaproteobacteria bacterium]